MGIIDPDSAVHQSAQFRIAGPRLELQQQTVPGRPPSGAHRFERPGRSRDFGRAPAPAVQAATMSDVISRVLIRCPETGETVGAILRLRPSAFETLRGEHRFRCSRCGQVHTWRKEDAWLEKAASASVRLGGV